MVHHPMEAMAWALSDFLLGYARNIRSEIVVCTLDLWDVALHKLMLGFGQWWVRPSGGVMNRRLCRKLTGDISVLLNG